MNRSSTYKLSTYKYLNIAKRLFDRKLIGADEFKMLKAYEDGETRELYFEDQEYSCSMHDYIKQLSTKLSTEEASVVSSIFQNSTLYSESVLPYIIRKDEQYSKDGKVFTVRRFYCTNDPKELLSRFPDDDVNKCFHEFVRKNTTQRIRLDIDADYDKLCALDSVRIARDASCIRYIDDMEHAKKEILEQHITALINTLQSTYFIEDKPNICVCSTHRDKKISYHIILVNYCIRSKLDVERFIDAYSTELGKIDKYLTVASTQVFDSAPLTSGSLRMLGCYKNGVSNPKVLETDHSFEDSLIRTQYDTKKCKALKYMGTYEPHEYDSEDGLTQMGIRIAKDVCNRLFANTYDSTIYEASSTFRMITFARRIGHTECEWCDDANHERRGLSIKAMGNSFYARCQRFSADDSKELKWIKVYEFNVPRWMIEAVIGGPRYSSQLIYPESATVINESELDGSRIQELLDVDTLLIRSPMGSGKTKAFIKYLDSLPPSPGAIIIISFRQTFTTELMTKLSAHKFKDYRSYKSNSIPIVDETRIIVQYESLHRLDMIADAPFLVVMDESESVLAQIDHFIGRGSYARERFDTLSYIVKSATKYLAMDAFLNTRTIDFVKRNRSTEYKMILNHHQPWKDKTFMFVSESFMGNKILNSVDNGDKIVISTNSKTYAQSVKRLIEEHYNEIADKAAKEEELRSIDVIQNNRGDEIDREVAVKTLMDNEVSRLKIGIYTAEDGDKKDLSNIKEKWSELDVLIYSPTIMAGISFEETHFDTLFCYYSNVSSPASSCVQQMCRIRNFKNKNVYVAMPNFTNVTRQSETIAQLELDVKAHINGCGSTSDKALLLEVLNSQKVRGPDGGWYISDKDDYIRARMLNEVESNVSHNNFSSYFIELISNHGAKRAIGETFYPFIQSGWNVQSETAVQKFSVKDNEKNNRFSTNDAVDLELVNYTEEYVINHFTSLTGAEYNSLHVVEPSLSITDRVLLYTLFTKVNVDISDNLYIDYVDIDAEYAYQRRLRDVKKPKSKPTKEYFSNMVKVRHQQLKERVEVFAKAETMSWVEIAKYNNESVPDDLRVSYDKSTIMHRYRVREAEIDILNSDKERGERWMKVYTPQAVRNAYSNLINILFASKQCGVYNGPIRYNKEAADTNDTLRDIKHNPCHMIKLSLDIIEAFGFNFKNIEDMRKVHHLEVPLDTGLKEVRKRLTAVVNSSHEVIKKDLTSKIKTGKNMECSSDRLLLSFANACLKKTLQLKITAPQLMKTPNMKMYTLEPTGVFQWDEKDQLYRTCI